MARTSRLTESNCHLESAAFRCDTVCWPRTVNRAGMRPVLNHPTRLFERMKKFLLSCTAAALGCCFLMSAMGYAQVPQLLNYQGRVAVGSVNFSGSGQFKFALVNTDGSATYWSNDGTSSAGSQPTAGVTLTVTHGLYSVLLGDTSLPNMTQAIPASVFNNSDVRLRVWFNDGTNGSQLLMPD